MVSSINEAFMRLQRRAEMSDRSKLVDTFVDVGPLFTRLSSTDHQVLYGRRGTGKTHVLSYLAETMEKRNDCVIYIDMRTLGSTGGIYPDDSITVAQRATRLLVDTLTAIHEGITIYCIDRAEELDLSYTGPLLDRLAEAITEVAITGTVELGETTSDGTEESISAQTALSADASGIKATLGSTTGEKLTRSTEYRRTESGVAGYRIHFGRVGQALRDIANALGQHQTWLLLDEWSSVPLDLQPFLADLLKRTVFPVPKITVKIAAIEQRSRFRIPTEQHGYIGVELGADITADLNLDDFMVFENNAEGAKQFFRELLFKHTKAITDVATPNTSLELIRQGFTQQNAFDEFVQATEGVPRDAINIITIAAQRALDGPISMAHIRGAARDWYQRDKEGALREQEQARDLLHWFITEVIGTRRARAFLLRSTAVPELIESLFDARLLHVLKKNISGRDLPGVRYDAYKLDYGCYVDLMHTARAPETLFSLGSDEDNLAVPQDDYRAIRRAILNIDEFSQHTQNASV